MDRVPAPSPSPAVAALQRLAVPVAGLVVSTNRGMVTRTWQHRKGDEYVVIVARYVGNERDGFACEHTRPYHPTEQLSHAISQGFTYAESDDFNVGVIRKGRLVATLWMKDVVDDDPELMASIAKEDGL